MAFLGALSERFGVWKVRGGLAVLIIVVVIGSTLLLRSEDSATEVGDEPLRVTLAPIAALEGGDSRTFVGSVVAVSQAKLETEAGGRITSVSVAIGDRVRAGTVIAQIENASERAALTQAEGAYEAAKAGALQSDSGVRDAETALNRAKNDGVSAYRNAYTTANNVLVTAIDPFFSSPQSAIPGLRVTGPASYLNSERVAFQSIMSEWQQDAATLGTASDLPTLLPAAENRVSRLIGVLDALIDVTTTRNSDTLAGRTLDTYTSSLLGARATLDGVVNSLQSAASGITAANEALTRAQVSGTSADVSLANAQVKQALGALQAAQAAYAKTIVRSPITGTVNALQVKVGDTVGQGAPVAEVVNDSAYELSFFVTEAERAQLTVGDTVSIDGTSTGTITSIAPALDPRTQKIEVKVALESSDQLSGSTALVSLVTKTATSSAPRDTLSVPITAIAFSIEGGALLTVTDGLVSAIPVTLGETRGSRIEITGDIGPDTVIITDARGLIVGQQVVTE
jgi:RND family efflux transporter MFP subunit